VNSAPAKFYGIGVGPGEPGLLPLAAWRALKTCDIIFAPRATSADVSAARQCLRGLEIEEEKCREIPFLMTSNRDVLKAHYRELAETISAELQAGKTVAYLTLGDPLTYSTYGYTLAALQDALPTLNHRTFPGVTSYAAVAAAMNWPLGEGRERVLILPCPDDMKNLRRDIETHDIVVLMKISERLPRVLTLLREMEIEEHCVLASHIGMPNEKLFPSLASLESDVSSGYLATMLIRKTAREQRHT
jgi:precorrin-2/cobalt-factor-2 C20-methyltransferase